jgi:hypothetical protein
VRCLINKLTVLQPRAQACLLFTHVYIWLLRSLGAPRAHFVVTFGGINFYTGFRGWSCGSPGSSVPRAPIAPQRFPFCTLPFRMPIAFKRKAPLQGQTNGPCALFDPLLFQLPHPFVSCLIIKPLLVPLLVKDARAASGLLLRALHFAHCALPLVV